MGAQSWDVRKWCSNSAWIGEGVVECKLVFRQAGNHRIGFVSKMTELGCAWFVGVVGT